MRFGKTKEKIKKKKDPSLVAQNTLDTSSEADSKKAAGGE